MLVVLDCLLQTPLGWPALRRRGRRCDLRGQFRRFHAIVGTILLGPEIKLAPIIHMVTVGIPCALLDGVRLRATTPESQLAT